MEGQLHLLHNIRGDKYEMSSLLAPYVHTQFRVLFCREGRRGVGWYEPIQHVE